MYVTTGNVAALNAFLQGHPVLDIRGGGGETFVVDYIDTEMLDGDYCSWRMQDSWVTILEDEVDTLGIKRQTTDSDNGFSLVSESGFTFEQFLADTTQKPRVLQEASVADSVAPNVMETSEARMWLDATVSPVLNPSPDVTGLFNLARIIDPTTVHVGPQSTVADRPIVVFAEQNGLDVVRYASGDLLETGTSQVVSQPWSMIIAGKRANDLGFIFMERTGGANAQLEVRNPSRLRMNCGAQLQTGNMTFDQNPHVVTLFADGANSEIFIDKVSEASGNAGSNSLDMIRLGDGSLDYDFYETLIINRLPTAQEQSDIEDYLIDKWSI